MIEAPTYDLQVILDTLFKTGKVYLGLDDNTLTDIPGSIQVLLLSHSSIGGKTTELRPLNSDIVQ